MPAPLAILTTAAFKAALGTAPDPEIAAKFGVSARVVQQHRVRVGIPAFVAVRRGQIDGAVLHGSANNSEIAREHGVTPRAVRKRRMLLDGPSPYTVEAEAKRAALLAYIAANPGASLVTAAAAVGLSRSRAYAIVQAHKGK